VYLRAFERPSRARSRTDGRSKAALIVLALLMVMVLGCFLVLWDRGKEQSGNLHRPAQVTSGALELSPLRGWAESASVPRLAGIEFQRPLVLEERASGMRLVAGVLAATSPTLLPPEFVRQLGAAIGQPDTIALGPGLKAYYYAGLTPAGSPGLVDVYVVPTTAGVATIACIAGPGLIAPFYDCSRNAATLKLRSGRPLRLGPDAAFRQRLPAAMSALEAARQRARAPLATRVPAQQAAAASDLAASYQAQAASLAPLAPVGRPWSRALVRELADAGRAYRSVAAALRSKDAGAFSVGQDAVHARERRIGQLLNGPAAD
jgi:hypothetical protein